MHSTRYLRPSWKALLQQTTRQTSIHSSAALGLSRPFSVFTKSPRDVLLTASLPGAARRCQHSQSLPASERQNTITSKAETPLPRTEVDKTASVPEAEAEQRDVPSYEITFTCKPCSTRSTHKISKQGYHKGTILITCPNCKNRHLICDHLNIFRDQSTTIEDILKEKGEQVRHGTLGAEGDIEIWDDGSTTDRSQTHLGEKAAFGTTSKEANS